MKEIKEIVINQAPIDASVQSREYIIKGDPGAVFSITITKIIIIITFLKTLLYKTQIQKLDLPLLFQLQQLD